MIQEPLRKILLSVLWTVASLTHQPALSATCHTIFDFAIDVQRFESQRFSVDTVSKEITDLDSREVIGTYSVKNPKFLFEWAERDSHIAWIERGGIMPWEMKEINNAKGQAAGKGFYVSLDPIDSISYGQSLIVFTQSKPILLLKYKDTIRRKIGTDTAYVERLARAGVGAFQSYARTWISVIHSDFLRKPSKISYSILLSHYKNEAKTLEIIGVLGKNNRLPKDFFQSVPASHVISRLLAGEKFSMEDVSDLKAVSTIFAKAGFQPPFLKKIQLTIAQDLLSDGLASQKTEWIGEFYEFTKHTKLSPEDLKTKHSSNDVRNSSYEEILDVFDIKTISALNSNLRLTEPLDLEQMKKVGAEWSRMTDLTDKTGKFKLQSFLELGSELFGFRPNFRNFSVVMAPELKSRTPRIKTNQNTIRALERNRFLSVSSVRNLGDGYSAYVEYANAKNYVRFRELLPTSLVEQLKSTNFESESSRVKNLNRLVVEYLTGILFDRSHHPKIAKFLGTQTLTAIDLYRMFMAIHPFEDGNGRMGRIFYILATKALEEYRGPLTPTIYDNDLMLSKGDFEADLNMGLILRAWISRSKSDSEFLGRCQKALKFLRTFSTDLETRYPELKVYFDRPERPVDIPP